MFINSISVSDLEQEAIHQLFNFIRSGQTDKIEDILRNNPNLNLNLCEPKSGETLLTLAVKENQLDTVGQLIRAKVDINKENNSNEQPFLIACQLGFQDIVEELVKPKE